MKTKVYVLKVDLPGGYTKGMRVIPLIGGGWRWEHTPVKCPWSPEVESKFFDEVIQPKYELKQKVWFQFDKNRYVKAEIMSNSTGLYRGKNNNSYTIKYGKTGGFNTLVVPEDKLFPLATYYFISSKGTIHSEDIIPSQQSNTDTFRQLVGNYFNTKDEAEAILNKMLKGEVKYTTPLHPAGDEVVMVTKSELLKMVVEQGKLHTIKFVKDNMHWGLRECKEYVDGIVESAGLTKLQINHSYIIQCLKENRKLEAVKQVKELTGWGLKESKEYCDNLTI